MPQIKLPARPEPIAFPPSQTALIVVDMQNAYATAGGYLDLAGFDVSVTQPVISKIAEAVTAARAAGIQIIWFQNGWDADYVEAGDAGSPNFHKSNALKTMRKRLELHGTLLSKGCRHRATAASLILHSTACCAAAGSVT